MKLFACIMKDNYFETPNLLQSASLFTQKNKLLLLQT